MISIVGLERADVLAALYNASRRSMGFAPPADPYLMQRDEAEILLQNVGHVFNDIADRALRVDLSGNEFDPQKYNQENGEGAAERAIEELRKSMATA